MNELERKEKISQIILLKEVYKSIIEGTTIQQVRNRIRGKINELEQSIYKPKGGKYGLHKFKD